jgi:hypothetical protein
MKSEIIFRLLNLFLFFNGKINTSGISSIFPVRPVPGAHPFFKLLFQIKDIKKLQKFIIYLAL